VRILGFDTATRATAVGLTDAAGEREARDDPPPGERPRHTTRLMALIVEVMEARGVGWDEIDRIAVGVGPGTFTGLRVGIATARALARAREIPLVGVSTLQSLALGAASESGESDLVLAVLDARRSEVFAAAWSAKGTALLDPVAVAPERLAEMIVERAWSPLAIGEGAIEFRAILERSGAQIPADSSQVHRVSAINHCRLARTQIGRAPDEVGPEYLRLPDAEIARRREDKQ
jgi:tRNA threonylcarbamoyladenosine biosynthesis protein TsaB